MKKNLMKIAYDMAVRNKGKGETIENVTANYLRLLIKAENMKTENMNKTVKVKADNSGSKSNVKKEKGKEYTERIEMINGQRVVVKVFTKVAGKKPEQTMYLGQEKHRYNNRYGKHGTTIRPTKI